MTRQNWRGALINHFSLWIDLMQFHIFLKILEGRNSRLPKSTSECPQSCQECGSPGRNPWDRPSSARVFQGSLSHMLSRTPEGLAASRLGGILSYVMYPIFQSVHFLSRSSSGMSCLLNLKRLPLIFHQNTKYVLTRLKCQNKRKMNLSDRGVQTVRGWWRLKSLSRNRKSPLRWSLVLEFLTSDRRRMGRMF